MSTTASNLQKNTESRTSRLLVICVDRDDDIGKREELPHPLLVEMHVLMLHKDLP